MLNRLERELATFIGPVASLAVKQASRATGDFNVLCASLSRYIHNESERTQFPQAGRQLTERMRDPTGWPTAKSSDLSAAPAATPLPSGALLDGIERNLVRAIGPIARIVIERHLRDFETLAKLHQALAAEIPDERERASFLNSVKCAE